MPRRQSMVPPAEPASAIGTVSTDAEVSPSARKVEYIEVSRPTRSGKWSLTSDGRTTLAIAIPASERKDSSRNGSGESTRERNQSPIASAPRASSVTRCIPTTRANLGARAPNTANESTGSAVSRPVSAAFRPSPWRTSSSTGPTLTAAGLRLKARTAMPTTTSTRWSLVSVFGSAWCTGRSNHPPEGPRCSPSGWSSSERRRAISRDLARVVEQRAPASDQSRPGEDRHGAHLVGGLRLDGSVRTITDAQRRIRLGRRHGLAEPVGSVEETAAAMTCLHATEPASVHLAAFARCGASIDAVDRALYDDRSVVKQLAMRRTVFAFPRGLLPAVWGSAAARVATQQRAQLARDVAKGGITTDGPAWVEEVTGAVFALVHDRGPMTTIELRAALPALDERLVVSPGKSYGGEFPVAPRVLTTLAASGVILRGTNEG